MAVYKQGILGPFSGKVGTVVGASWRGVPYIRSVASKVADAKTAAQLEVRNRLSAVTRAIRPFLESIRHGFINAGVASGWPQAVKVNRQKATKTVGNEFQLLPQDIIIAEGTALFEASASLSGSNLTVQWDAPTPYDELYGANVYVAVLNETSGKALNYSADISAGETTLSVASIQESSDTDVLHLYYFAATSDLASPSVHQALS